MLIITIFFYKEPKREIEGVTLGQKFKDMGVALSDMKFLAFLVILGLFFWLPFWSFFNVLAVYIDTNLNTVSLYKSLESVFGPWFAGFFSHVDKDGTRRILGETISQTGYLIILLQVFVSKIFKDFKPIPSFLLGLFVLLVGYIFVGLADISYPAFVYLGIALASIGEMIASPRIQEYITWIAPKEKAGLYMGTNFLAVAIGGALSGVIYTTLYGTFSNMNHPEYIWYALAANMFLGIVALFVFTKYIGEFKELSE